jgi:hypothetical protein
MRIVGRWYGLRVSLIAMNTRRRLTRWLALGCLSLAVTAVSAGSAGAAATKPCQKGRTVLQCGEKIGLYDDSLGASVGGFGDLVLFETKLPLPIGNPALSQFWLYQCATSIARSEFEAAITNQETDENIEQIARRVSMAAPVVRASGVIDRRTAATLSRLLLAEQQQVLNLAGMATALNRATAALVTRTRADWARYQESAAGGFAIHAAAATQRMIADQRAAERALIAKKLLFGVGPVDLKKAQKTVKRQRAFVPNVNNLITRFGLALPQIGAAEAEFVIANFGPTSVSLSQYLTSSTLVGGERALIRALRHYAARIPHAGVPPTG